MLHFALIDDDPHDLTRHRDLLEAYLDQRPRLVGEVTAFSSADELLAAARRGSFDLYILDILMPEQNGIQLGLRLRELDKRSVFIYLTSSPDFAVDAYSARAFHYLLKPVEPDRLFSALDEAVDALARRQEEVVVVRCKEGLVKLPVEKVVYAELFDKRLCCHLIGDETVQSVSLRQSFRKAAEGLLAHPAFALCGVSYAVNLNYVTRVERGRVYIRDALAIPLSRAYRETFTARWMDYHLEKGGG